MFVTVGKEDLISVLSHYVDFDLYRPADGGSFKISSFDYSCSEFPLEESISIRLFDTKGNPAIFLDLVHSDFQGADKFVIYRCSYGEYSVSSDCLDTKEVLDLLQILQDPDKIFHFCGKDELFQIFLVNLYRYFDEGSFSFDMDDCVYEDLSAGFCERIYIEHPAEPSGCNYYRFELQHHFAPCYNNDVFKFFLEIDGRL